VFANAAKYILDLDQNSYQPYLLGKIAAQIYRGGKFIFLFSLDFSISKAPFRAIAGATVLKMLESEGFTQQCCNMRN
jgi:hypothetical protein